MNLIEIMKQYRYLLVYETVEEANNWILSIGVEQNIMQSIVNFFVKFPPKN